MSAKIKTEQLQIRLTSQEKTLIRQAASRAGKDISSYVLDRVIAVPQEHFQQLLTNLAQERNSSLEFADLNDYLTGLAKHEFTSAVEEAPQAKLSPYHLNYVAAMVEHAAHLKDICPPPWVFDIAPLEIPVFGTELQSLRVYLLTHSLIPFRRRNIFIDSSIGARV